jgi:hypothetical protein
VSLLAAAVYVAYVESAMWAVFMQTLTVAGGFHNFVIRRFEEQ